MSRPGSVRAPAGVSVAADALGRLPLLRQAEVDQLRASRVRDHHVRGLEVAVHDAVRVRFREPLGHLDRQVEGAGRAHAARHQRRERPAADELHGDEGRPLALVDLVDDADGRVGERRGRARLQAQAALALRVVARTGDQHLQGHLPPEPQVGRAVDDAHAALADLPGDPVPPERPGPFGHGPILWPDETVARRKRPPFGRIGLGNGSRAPYPPAWKEIRCHRPARETRPAACSSASP